MRRKTLPRHSAAAGWSHPYSVHPFSPVLYADGGGDGDGSASGDDADGRQNDGDARQGAGDGHGDGARGAQGGDTGRVKPTGDKADDDPAATIRRLEKDLATARAEAAKDRTTAKQKAAEEAKAEQLKQIAKALGLEKDDTPPDPAKLAEQITAKDAAITEREATIRSKDVELAVWSRADKLQAKAGALLDSRSFLASVKDLDPSAKDFRAALDDAIKAALKDNPTAFAAAPSAGRSGGDLGGGTGEGDVKKQAARAAGGLSGAIRSHYGT